MELAYYNIQNGYAEAVVRGYRNNLLPAKAYDSLIESGGIANIRDLLGPHYGEYVRSLTDNSTLTTSLLQRRLRDKLVDDFTKVTTGLEGSLARFVEYIKHHYMIQNVTPIIQRAQLALSDNSVASSQDLIDVAHPLGWFDKLPALVGAQTINDVYDSVLVETPLGKYFETLLQDMNLEENQHDILRGILEKNYLEQFYNFVNTDPEIAGTVTAEIMSNILELKADRRTIILSLDLAGYDEVSIEMRERLFPTIGKLNPGARYKLMRVDDQEKVYPIVAETQLGEYINVLAAAGLSSQAVSDQAEVSVDRGFTKLELETARDVFTRQFHHATFYSWLFLQEQEIRDIVWIAECVVSDQKDRGKSVLP